MTALLAILTRWRLGLALAGGLSVLGLLLAAGHYRGAYHAEKAMRAADRSAYIAAQELARQKAEQARAATEARYQALADQKDREYATEIADARAAADAYIARMRVKAVTGAGGGTSAGASGDSAGGAVGAGQAPELVAVTADDIRICTDNTARLEKAREWALSLDGVK